MYFPKRDALGLKSVRALPNVSSTNSAAGIWDASLEPFLPGLLTESSMIDLMASRLFSDFPLAVSPLQCWSVSGAYCVGDGSAPEQNRLVLVRPAHVVVRIVRELEDMRG